MFLPLVLRKYYRKRLLEDSNDDLYHNENSGSVAIRPCPVMYTCMNHYAPQRLSRDWKTDSTELLKGNCGGSGGNGGKQ